MTFSPSRAPAGGLPARRRGTRLSAMVDQRTAEICAVHRVSSTRGDGLVTGDNIIHGNVANRAPRWRGASASIATISFAAALPDTPTERLLTGTSDLGNGSSMATRAHFSVALTLHHHTTCPNWPRTVNGARKHAPIGERPRGAAVARRIRTSTGAVSPGCLPSTRSS